MGICLLCLHCFTCSLLVSTSLSSGEHGVFNTHTCARRHTPSRHVCTCAWMKGCRRLYKQGIVFRDPILISAWNYFNNSRRSVWNVQYQECHLGSRHEPELQTGEMGLWNCGNAISLFADFSMATLTKTRQQMAVAHLSGLKWLSLLPYLTHRSTTQYAPSQVTNPNVVLLSDVLDVNLFFSFFFFLNHKSPLE